MIYRLMLVGLGGFLGAVSRFGIYEFFRNAGIARSFPMATLAVNVVGCAMIGFFFEAFRDHRAFPALTLFAVVGFLGAFTTFSAFGFETVELVRNQEWKIAILNVVGNVALCFIGVVLGGWFGTSLKA